MTFRILKRFVLPPFFQTLFYGLTFFTFSLFITQSAHAEFKDVSQEELFYPHIETLSNAYFLTGDTHLGDPTGYFRPFDSLNRAELAKLATVMRLASDFGKMDDWPDIDQESLEKAIFNRLKNYLNCDQGACENIDDKPFEDVPEVDLSCLKTKDLEKNCVPWFSKFVYYAVEKGFVQGYKPKFKLIGKPDRYFGPSDNIIRLHAIKMFVVDDSNKALKDDWQYTFLRVTAEENGSYAPKCLMGAENMILDLAGGNNKDSQKLLDYAIMADRVDFFGNDCQVMKRDGAMTPEQRAQWLMRPLPRQEAARYFAISIYYSPLFPEIDQDPTLNNADENENSPSGDEDYEIPKYEKTGIELSNEEFEVPKAKYEPPEVEKEPSEEEASEEVIPDVPGCEAKYKVDSITNNPVRFTSGSDEQVVSIRVENTSGQAWKNDCKFSLSYGTWVDEKNQERSGRGFEWEDRIDALKVVDGYEGEVSDDGQRATFNLRVQPAAADRSMNEFKMNGHLPTSGPEGIYVYAENKGVSPAERAFKTSVPEVTVRAQPISSAKELMVIQNENVSVTVTGHAVLGQEVDLYKSYMWYPVQVDGVRGFVLATLLYPEKIGSIDLQRNIVSGWLRPGDETIKGIVLHYTIGDGENSALDESGGTADGVGAHYFIDRSGGIAQAVKTFMEIGHVGPGTKKQKKMWEEDQERLIDGNEYTVGIELINTGLIYKQENGTFQDAYGYDYYYNNQEDVSQKNPEGWEVWSHKNGEGKNTNDAWGAKNELSNTLWENFTDPQLQTACYLIYSLSESLDIPVKPFETENNIDYPNLNNAEEDKNSFYYYPAFTNLRPNYNQEIENFYGVYGHHNIVGKYDTSPSLDLNQVLNCN